MDDILTTRGYQLVSSREDVSKRKKSQSCHHSAGPKPEPHHVIHDIINYPVRAALSGGHLITQH